MVLEKHTPIRSPHAHAKSDRSRTSLAHVGFAMESKMVRIQLGGHAPGSVVRGYSIVDDDDQELSLVQWHLCGGGYARRKTYYGATWFESMHRVVMERVIGRAMLRSELVDHVNGDKLDNRRDNLRIVTDNGNQQNRTKPHSRNKSGHRGVVWHKSGEKWQAQVFCMGKSHYCGLFSCKEDAAEAAQKKRDELGFLKGIP